MKSRGIRCLIIIDEANDQPPALTVCGQSIFNAQAVTTRLILTTCGLCLNRLDEEAARQMSKDECKEEVEDDDPFWSKLDHDWEFEKEEF